MRRIDIKKGILTQLLDIFGKQLIIKNNIQTRYTVHGRGAKTLRLRVELNFKSEHFLEKSSKKSFKNGPKYFSFAKDIYTLTTFLQKVLKPVFQNPTVRGMCPPLISASQKSPKIRTDERMNGRTDGTSGFDQPTDVKSASRKKPEMLKFSLKCSEISSDRETIIQKTPRGFSFLFRIFFELIFFIGQSFRNRCTKIWKFR